MNRCHQITIPRHLAYSLSFLVISVHFLQFFQKCPKIFVESKEVETDKLKAGRGRNKVDRCRKGEGGSIK